MPGCSRHDIKIGSEVGVVLKEHQAMGTITMGIVKEILTKSAFHPHGIKVKLVDGKVGRVKEVYS